MAQGLSYYEAKIRAALRAAGKYNEALAIQVHTLASAMCTLDMATYDVAGLKSCVVEGLHGVKAHPAFKIQRDAQESVTRQMKALGLTAESLKGTDANDPLIELTRNVQDILSKS